MTLDVAEKWTRILGVLLGSATLAFALWRGVWQGLQQSAGRTTGAAALVLRRPLQLVFGLGWLALCFLLWKPLPFTLPKPARSVACVCGALLYGLGLILYLWGAHTLGELYRPSSALGVQLNAEHRLIMHGPFALVRHPMYLALQIAALGGLLLYRTWTFVFIFASFLSLIWRARQEDQALAAEFGDQWVSYARRVPAWLPSFQC